MPVVVDRDAPFTNIGEDTNVEVFPGGAIFEEVNECGPGGARNIVVVLEAGKNRSMTRQKVWKILKRSLDTINSAGDRRRVRNGCRKKWPRDLTKSCHLSCFFQRF